MGNRTVQSVECSSEEILGLGSLLVLLAISGIFLNLTVIVTLVRNRFLRSANNCLVANLAVADVTYVTITCVTSLVAIVTVEWRFSQGTCVFIGYIGHVAYSASIAICTFISFHRFVSIVYPQRRFVNSLREAQHSVTSIWCVSALMCLPGVFKSNVYLFNPVVRTCSLLGVFDSDRFYILYALLVNFFLPIALMLTFYVRIYRAVQMPSVSRADALHHHTKVIKRKSKHLMVAVLTMFLVTWMPFNMAMLYSAFYSRPLSSSIVIVVWMLKLLSTIANPILYGVCNRLYSRCMLRLLKCRGPLRSKMSAIMSREHFADGEYFTNYPTVTMITDGKHCTSHPQLSYTCSQCLEHAKLEGYQRQKVSLPSLISNGTQTARLSTVAEQEDEGEKDPEVSKIRDEQLEAKDSTCSTCSCRSSIPTVMKYPVRRFRRSLSTSSQISHYAFGPTPTDSGRSSLGSQYVPTPGFYSNRTSFSSQFVPTPIGSTRTSVASQCMHYLNMTQGSSCNTPAVLDGSTPGPEIRIRRLGSLNSRQSFYSASRSARSSSLSSRLSHSNPFSARSSVTSQLNSNQSTPFSTRPSTPGTQDLDGELLGGFLAPPLGSPRTNRVFSYPGRTVGGPRGQPRPVFHVLPEEYGMFEELGVEGENRDLSPRVSPLQTPDPASRLSVLMLGDLDPSEFTESMEEEEERFNIVKAVSANVQKAMQAWDGFQKFGKFGSRAGSRRGSRLDSSRYSPRNSPRSSPRASRSRDTGYRSGEAGHRERVNTILEKRV